MVCVALPGWNSLEDVHAPHSSKVIIPIGAKIITHTTFIVGELILQLHTHQLHSFDSRGINLCNACVSLVSACFASMIFQKGNYTQQKCSGN